MRWIAKAGIQAVLARIWGGERINHRLQRAFGVIGSAGSLAKRVQYGVSFWKRNGDLLAPEGKHVLEIGTGWDAIHTVLLSALGAGKITTFDHLPHIRLELVLDVARAWRTRAGDLAGISGQPAERIESRLDSILCRKDLQSLFESMNATYIAPGDICATGLPDRSLDMVYGYAVLAHLPKPVLGAFCRECARVLVPGGLSIQRIGLEDPFNDWKDGDVVDFLRHSPLMWRFIGEHSILFHNRLRAVEFRQAFEAHGGRTIRSTETLLAKSLARVKTMKIAAPFRRFTPEQLAVSELDLISRFGSPSSDHFETVRS